MWALTRRRRFRRGPFEDRSVAATKSGVGRADFGGDSIGRHCQMAQLLPPDTSRLPCASTAICPRSGSGWPRPDQPVGGGLVTADDGFVVVVVVVVVAVVVGVPAGGMVLGAVLEGCLVAFGSTTGLIGFA
jgi:hypothetical protein